MFTRQRRLILVAMCFFSLVPVVIHSLQTEPPEANNSLDPEVVRVRAELLEAVAARGLEGGMDDIQGSEVERIGSNLGQDKVEIVSVRDGSLEGMQKKMATMAAEVARLTALNAELRALVQPEGDIGNEAPTAPPVEMEVAEAAARQAMHLKVVGSAAKSKEDEAFLLDLAALKLSEGDLGTAAGLYRSHLALFTGTETGRESAARRMVRMFDGEERSRAGRYLAAAMVADETSARYLLEIAGQLERDSLLAENRRAASGLLELYLSHHSWAAEVWHRLGRLRRRDGRLAEAVHCHQVAASLQPWEKEMVASYEEVAAELATQSWLPPRAPRVYVVQSTTSKAQEAHALAELHAVLTTTGVNSVLVVAPKRAGSKKRRAKEKNGVAVAPGSSSLGEGATENVTFSLPVEQLEAGDIVFFAASCPAPPQWMHAARLRQALLVSWLFSWRDLTSVGASGGLDAPPNALWLNWDAGMVAHMMEGDIVKATGSGGASQDWLYRAATSHSVWWSSSAPIGAMLVPPLPRSLHHRGQNDQRLGLMVHESDFPGVGSADPQKDDLILCRGSRRKCLAIIHDTLRALPGSGFCPVPLGKIVDLEPGSPAHNTGLMPDDELVGVGLLAGGLVGGQQALNDEVLHGRDGTLHVTVVRQYQHRATVLSFEVKLQAWQGSSLLGWTLAIAPSTGCTRSTAELFALPRTPHVAPLPIKTAYLSPDANAEDTRAVLLPAKVLVRQPSWGSSARDMTDGTLGTVELQAALNDVCILVPSDAAAAVDWPIGSRLIFEPHVDTEQMPVLLLQMLRDFDTLSPERSVLKDYIRGLPATLGSAAQRMVQSSQYLFYAVALDVRDESAACSLILSARLSHPLASVEVLVRDVQLFYHTHAAFVLQLKERGLWNGVWLSQISAAALEHVATGVLNDASRLHVALLARPLALHSGRRYRMACLVDPHLLMLPSAPHGPLDTLANYSWPSAPYMAWVHKGSMRLPVCYRPSAMHAKLSRATVSPPAGAEPPGKYLYRAMLGIAGFPMHKRLGDTNAILASLGAMLPALDAGSGTSVDLPTLSDGEKQNLEMLLAHPAWAAAQAYLSSDRRVAVRSLSEHVQSPLPNVDVSEDSTSLKEAHVRARGIGRGGSDDDKVLQIDQPEGQRIEGAELDGRHLEQEVKDLRERVRAMMYEVSEAKRLQQGWQVM